MSELIRLPPPPMDLVRLVMSTDNSNLERTLSEVNNRLQRHDVMFADVMDRLLRLTARLDKFEKNVHDSLQNHGQNHTKLLEEYLDTKGVVSGHTTALKQADDHFSDINSKIVSIREVLKHHEDTLTPITTMKKHVQDRISISESNTNDRIQQTAEKTLEMSVYNLNKCVSAVEERFSINLQRKCNTEDVLRHIESARVAQSKVTDRLEKSISNVAIQLEVTTSQIQVDMKKMHAVETARLDNTDFELSCLRESLCVTAKDVQSVRNQPEEVRASMWLQRAPFVLLRDCSMTDCVSRINQILFENNSDVFDALEVLKDEIRTKIDKEQIMEIITSMNESDVDKRLATVEQSLSQMEHVYVTNRGLAEALRDKADARTLDAKVDRAYVASVFEYLSEQVHEMQQERNREQYDIGNVREVMKDLTTKLHTQEFLLNDIQQQETQLNQMVSTDHTALQHALVSSPHQRALVTVPSMRFLSSKQHQQQQSTAPLFPPTATSLGSFDPRFHAPVQGKELFPRAVPQPPSSSKPSSRSSQKPNSRSGGISGAQSFRKTYKSVPQGLSEGGRAEETESTVSAPLPPLELTGPLTQGQIAYLKAIHPNMSTKT